MGNYGGLCVEQVVFKWSIKYVMVAFLSSSPSSKPLQGLFEGFLNKTYFPWAVTVVEETHLK